jgi:hypothetical protein
MTMFLKRNPSLSREEFVRHHIEKHGPLFRSISEAVDHVIRYIQTHPIATTTDAVDVDDYDGTAEIWFDDVAGLETVLGSQTYRDKVFPDEKTFLDHEHTLVVLGEPVEIIG